MTLKSFEFQNYMFSVRQAANAIDRTSKCSNLPQTLLPVDVVKYEGSFSQNICIGAG